MAPVGTVRRRCADGSGRAGGCRSSDTISAPRRWIRPARALFVEARRNAWASNLALLAAARPALESLAAASIRTMLLKGAVLASPPYGEPGLRHTQHGRRPRKYVKRDRAAHELPSGVDD